MKHTHWGVQEFCTPLHHPTSPTIREMTQHDNQRLCCTWRSNDPFRQEWINAGIHQRKTLAQEIGPLRASRLKFNTGGWKATLRLSSLMKKIWIRVARVSPNDLVVRRSGSPRCTRRGGSYTVDRAILQAQTESAVTLLERGCEHNG